MRGDGIVPVMEVGSNNGNSGFGGYGNGDWAWIIVLFLIFGWGRNGFGNGFGNGNGCGSNTTCATPADVYNAVDQQTLISKLDQQTYGLADTFNALNNTLNTNFRGIDNAICTLGYQALQHTNALSSQLADCCCTTQRAIDSVNYNMAINTNSIQQTLCNNTRDIIENQNANYRALHEELVANKLEAKNDRIAEQQNEINALRLKASQEAQNAYLISQLGPKCPEPAYVVNGPTPVNFPTNCCNTFSGFNSCGTY